MCRENGNDFPKILGNMEVVIGKNAVSMNGILMCQTYIIAQYVTIFHPIVSATIKPTMLSCKYEAPIAITRIISIFRVMKFDH